MLRPLLLVILADPLALLLGLFLLDDLAQDGTLPEVAKAVGPPFIPKYAGDNVLLQRG